MNRKQLLILGYAIAAVGFAVYFFTRQTGGMMFGGVFLVLTSLCKMIGDRCDKNGKQRKEKKKGSGKA